jgi:hypothetical protein
MAVAYDVPIPGYYTRFSTCMAKEDRTMHVHTLSSTWRREPVLRTLPVLRECPEDRAQ